MQTTNNFYSHEINYDNLRYNVEKFQNERTEKRNAKTNKQIAKYAKKCDALSRKGKSAFFIKAKYSTPSLMKVKEYFKYDPEIIVEKIKGRKNKEYIKISWPKKHF